MHILVLELQENEKSYTLQQESKQKGVNEEDLEVLKSTVIIPT